ncbi:MAG: ABC transporter ATP-binding protein, partial [Gammaproteobacteria bacterium]|nr:ABC transporter ATP-binding protein [Gammaproteobacteria bacterium]
GLMKPDSGTGNCLGYDIIHEQRHIKRLVGYVPQTFSLYKDLTIRENLQFIANVYEQAHPNEIIAQALDEFGLTRYQNHLAGVLSGGWKQRLSLAAALIHKPKLLLLDEPTAGVDPKTRRDFWNDIYKLTEQGVSALVSTHYIDEAERCNRLAYIIYGHLLVCGTLTEITQQVGISTWAAQGEHLDELIAILSKEPKLYRVVTFGNEIKVSSTHHDQLEKMIQQFPQWSWRKVPSDLEEIFIHLVEKYKQNNL